MFKTLVRKALTQCIRLLVSAITERVDHSNWISVGYVTLMHCHGTALYTKANNTSHATSARHGIHMRHMRQGHAEP